MKFVTSKTVEQLDLQGLHRVRERLVGQRTSVINQIRAFLLERGVAVRQGFRALRTEMPIILAPNRDLIHWCKTVLPSLTVFSCNARRVHTLGSSTFRLSTTTVSMSLTGSCFSSESAPRPLYVTFFVEEFAGAAYLFLRRFLNLISKSVSSSRPAHR
jgi:hypothetical protein